MPLSLRARLTLAYGGSFAIILIVIFVALHRILGASLINDLDRQLDAFARDIAQEATRAEGPLDPELTATLLDRVYTARLPEQPGFVVVASRAAQKEVISGRTAVDPEDLKRLRDAVFESGQGTYDSVPLPGGVSIRVRTLPLILREGTVLGVVQAGQSEQTIDTALSKLERMLIIGGGIGFAGALILGYVVTSQGLKPLKDVVSLARRIHARRLDERLGLAHGPREVRELADTFDAMLGRIREAFDQQQRFVADVSHELRTPLTALRGNIDVMLLDPTLPPDVVQQLRLVSAECSRLIRLSSNLLYIAQAELARPPDRRPVDLDVLCLEVFHQMRDIKPGVAVRLAHEDQVTIVGDRDRLKQLLLNLTDNAIKYTPAGGSVSLALHREPGWARITVKDTGIGIPPDKKELIFQRFYTVDQRTDRAVKGAGLGLAIVDWVVKSHEGTIELESEAGKGTTFTVRLPRPAAEIEIEEEPPETVAEEEPASV